MTSFPTTDASRIYHENATADFARRDATADPASLAEAMKSAILITSTIYIPMAIGIETTGKDD